MSDPTPQPALRPIAAVAEEAGILRSELDARGAFVA